MSYINNRMGELKLSSTPKLIISKELQAEIMSMHAFCGNTEWSGPLFYKVMEGDINTPSELVLKALHVYPYDIGTPGYTEFDFDEKMMDYYEAYPECTRSRGAKWGLIHTHHQMGTFFSNTDLSELHDNSEKHNYYVSLIVNHISDFKAKIAIVAERTVKISQEEDFISFTGSDGKPTKIDLSSTARKDTVEKVLVHMDCEIIFEKDVFFSDRITALKSTPRRVPIITYPTKSVIGFGKNKDNKQGKFNWQTNIWEGGDDDYISDYYYDNYGPKKGGSNAPIYKGNQDKEEIIFDTLNVKNFLVKWISGDMLCEDRLSDVLKEANKTTRGKVLDGYILKLDSSLKDTFGEVFNVEYKDITPEMVGDLALACTKQLKGCQDYAVATDIIKECLDLYLEEEGEESVDYEIVKK